MSQLRASLRIFHIALLGFSVLASLGCMMAKNSGGGTEKSDGGTDEPPFTAPVPDATTVPTEPAALFTFLASGAYGGFPQQASAHLPFGPHGISGVRVFYDTLLYESVMGPVGPHPKGSSAIAELYGANKTLSGWAVSVKTASHSDGGFGWFWYEIASTDDPTKLVGQGNGLGECIGCHAAGEDYVLTPLL